MRFVSHSLAILIVLHLFLTGLWDIYILYGPPGGTTVSEEIRQSWLRYPMAILIAGFLFVHFWKR